MRLLFLSNYYPPEALGGYEMWCRDVAQALQCRGHEVAVLTSGLRDAYLDGAVMVYPRFELEVVGGLASTLRRLPNRTSREERDAAAVEHVVDSFKPDAAVIWGMWNVPRVIPAVVEAALPDRTAYYFCDYWAALPRASSQQLSAPADRPLLQLAKSLTSVLLGPVARRQHAAPLRIARGICCSKAVADELRRSGAVQDAPVVHGGIDLARFPQRSPRPRQRDDELRLIYLGRLSPEKGIETAVEAMKQLAAGETRAMLDIWGVGPTGYTERLRSLVQDARIDSEVKFRGAAKADDVPRILADYDALIFPSVWPEPFPRTVLEAMAIGLPVIGTTNGGTGEVLFDGVTGLTFHSAASLVEKVETLVADHSRAAQLVVAARQRVEQQFPFERMLSGLEQHFESLAAQARAA